MKLKRKQVPFTKTRLQLWIRKSISARALYLLTVQTAHCTPPSSCKETWANWNYRYARHFAYPPETLSLLIRDNSPVYLGWHSMANHFVISLLKYPRIHRHVFFFSPLAPLNFLYPALLSDPQNQRHCCSKCRPVVYRYRCCCSFGAFDVIVNLWKTDNNFEPSRDDSEQVLSLPRSCTLLNLQNSWH